MLYGLDIGGTKMELAAFDGQLRQQACWRTATPVNDYRDFLAAVADLVAKAEQSGEPCQSLGIGLPAVIEAGGAVHSANIPCLNGRSVGGDLASLLERPVLLEHDVKTFILSEANGGAAGGARHALGVILGTGVSGGLCIDGRLYRGRQNIAGEYGHTALPCTVRQQYDLPLRACGCGKTGCVEQYLAGPALLWLCERYDGGYTSVPEFAGALQRGEARAREIFAVYLDCLGCFLAQLTLMFDPDMLVLGGGLSNIAALYPELPPAIQRHLLSGVAAPRVAPPRFGDASGVRGAALLLGEVSS